MNLTALINLTGLTREQLISIALVPVGLLIAFIYALLIFGKHGVLTGKDDE